MACKERAATRSTRNHSQADKTWKPWSKRLQCRNQLWQIPPQNVSTVTISGWMPHPWLQTVTHHWYSKNHFKASKTWWKSSESKKEVPLQRQYKCWFFRCSQKPEERNHGGNGCQNSLNHIPASGHFNFNFSNTNATSGSIPSNLGLPPQYQLMISRMPLLIGNMQVPVAQTHL